MISRRRLLVRGLTPDSVVARLRSYEDLYPGLPHAYAFRVSVPVGEWVEVDVPVDVPLLQFHNLAKWMEGDADTEPADDTFVQSVGEPPWGYWLVPNDKPGTPDWFLSGATDDGTPFQWDCVGLRPVDDARIRRAPMPPRLAMMTRGVHARLQDPAFEPEAHLTVPLHLEAPGEQHFELPEPDTLSKTFARTPDPNDRGGGLGSVLGFLGNLLRGKVE